MICPTCQTPFDHRASSHQGPECDGCCEEKQAVTQRVTDKELAEMISATGDWDTEIADAVASDLLDARAEIASLRAKLAAVGEGKK